MDDAKVELVGHYRCLCTQLPFGGPGGPHGARCSPESGYRGRGGGGGPHHSAGSASLLPACFNSCPTTFFARKVSRVYSRTSWNRCSRKSEVNSRPFPQLRNLLGEVAWRFVSSYAFPVFSDACPRGKW